MGFDPKKYGAVKVEDDKNENSFDPSKYGAVAIEKKNPSPTTASNSSNGVSPTQSQSGVKNNLPPRLLSSQDMPKDDRTKGDIVQMQPKPIIAQTEADRKETQRLIEQKAQRIKTDTDEAAVRYAKTKLRQQGKAVDPNSNEFWNAVGDAKMKLESGDAVLGYDREGKPGLKQSLGFLQSIPESYKATNKAEEDSHNFMRNMGTKERVAYMDEKEKEENKGEYIGQQLDYGGEMVGSNVKTVGRVALATGVAGLINYASGGTLSGVTPTLITGVLAPTGMNAAAANQIQSQYLAYRKQHPEWTKEQAMQEAEKGAILGNIRGAVEAGVMAEMPKIKMPLSLEGKNVIAKAITNTANAAASGGAIVGGLTAAEQGARNLTGAPTTAKEDEETVANAIESATTTFGALHAVTGELVPGAFKLPKYVKSAFKYGIVKSETSPAEIEQVLQESEQQGRIPQGTAEKVMTDLQGYKTALDQVQQEGLKPEVEASIAGLQQKKNNLIEKKTEENAADTDAEISKINQQIDDIKRTGKPEEHEVNEVTGKTYAEEISKPIELDHIGSDEFKDFVDKNYVSEERLNLIAEKVKKQQPLTPNETAIFHGKTAEINKIIAGEKPNDTGNTSTSSQVTEPLQQTTTEQEQQGNKEAVQSNPEPVGQGNGEATPAVLKEGDTVNLEPQIKGGLPRTMEYTKEGWKQRVGKELTNVSDKVKEQAQAKWDEANTTKTNIQTEEAKPVETKTTENSKPTSVLEKPKEEVSIDDILGELLGETKDKDVSNGKLSEGQGSVDEYISKANDVLKKIFPNAELKTFNTTAEYEASGGTRNTRGEIEYGKEGKHTVKLDLQRIREDNSTKTAVHEVVHPIVYGAFTAKNENLIPLWNEVAAEMKGKEGFDKVMQHASNYDRANVATEGLTEFITQVVTGGISLKDVPKSTINKIIELVNKVFEAAGSSFRIETINDLGEIARKVKEAFDTGDTSKLQKAVKGENIDNLIKEHERSISQDVSAEQRQKLLDLLKEKVQDELKAGKITQEQANEYYKKAGIEPPKVEEPKGGKDNENGGIGITHAETKKIAEEKGFEQYQKDPQTFEEWDAEAEKRIKNGELPDLIKKMERGDEISAVEQRMMGKYIATLNNAVDKNPTPKNIEELKKAVQLSDVVGGRQAGKSLAARKRSFLPEDSLGMFLLDKEANQGFPLSEQQIQEQSKQYNDLKAAHEALNARLQQVEEENARLIAENGINKAKAIRNRQSKKTHEEYVSERKDAIQGLRDALKKVREETNAVVVPGAKELVAAAPHIKKLVQSLINEGADKLDVIVNDVYYYVKDEIEGITKRDIINVIAGKHDEQKQTKSDINRELRLLQREADLMGQLDAARKGYENASTQSKKAITNARIKELEQKIKDVRALNKERIEQNFEEVTQTQKNIISKIEKLEKKLKDKDFSEEKKPAPKLKIDHRTQILQDKVIELEKKIALEKLKDRLAKRGKAEKIYDFATKEVLGVKRILQTLGDFSAWARQTNRLAFNPRKWDVFAKEVQKSFLATFSQQRFDRYMNEIHKDPHFNEMEKDGIKFNDFSTDEIDKQNELYQQNWLFKVPVLKEVPLASQRGADAALNIARIELYKKYKTQLENQGITRESDPEVYKAMANEVMNQTGRGKLAKLFEESATSKKILGNTFYGARLMASTFNQLNPAYYAKMPKEVRGLIWKDIASYAVTLMATGAAAKAMGATISLNPDDSDFMQIRMGKKVYDITGGKSQYIRTALRILEAIYATGARVTGNMSKKEASEKQKLAGTSTLRFFRNKLAPNTGLVTNAILPQSEFGGREVELKNLVEFYPMYTEDAIKAFQNEGLTAILTTIAPNLIGIGYNEYFNGEKQSNLVEMDETLKRNMRSEEQDFSKIMNYKKNPKGDPLTDSEIKTYIQKRDAEIEKAIKEFYEKGRYMIVDGKLKRVKYSEATKDQIIDETSSIKTAATRKVKKELFGEKETSQDKSLKKALKEAKENE